jgi:hypothetical protein
MELTGFQRERALAKPTSNLAALKALWAHERLIWVAKRSISEITF